MKKLLLSTAIALCLVQTSYAQDKTKACWVLVGPAGDFGYNYQHDQGRLESEKHFGDRLETTLLESVSEGADAERAFERHAREGCDIVFGTSFGYGDAINKVAKKHPDVKFEHATGYKQESDNLALYNARFYEGRYITGQIAAKMSKAGLGGYIASFPIPEVIMGINAFMLGAQSVNPDFQVKIIWVNSWYDPGKEADAAKALFDQGVDIISQHTDSTAPLQIAEERGLQGFGQSSDMIKFAPKAQLTSNTDDWAPYYISRIQAVMDGTWQPTNVWEGIREGAVHMTDYVNMPEGIAKEAEETERRIASGEFHPFTGPISDQEDNVKIADGQVISDEDLLQMNWFIKGIDETLPKK